MDLDNKMEKRGEEATLKLPSTHKSASRYILSVQLQRQHQTTTFSTEKCIRKRTLLSHDDDV